MENRSIPYGDHASLSGDSSGFDQFDQLDSKFFEENFLDPITSFVPVNKKFKRRLLVFSSRTENFTRGDSSEINHFRISFSAPYDYL